MVRDGKHVEIYPGSVANYINSQNLIDAYYVDYDLLNYAQDHTIFVMPSALSA